MSENISDTPAVVVRRRRRVVRHVREKTPEPTSKSVGCGGNEDVVKQKVSDDESSGAAETAINTSVNEQNTSIKNIKTTQPTEENVQEPVAGVPPPPSPSSARTPLISAHRSKILNRRDKTLGSSAVRSHSTPRPDESKPADNGIMSLIRQAKRSLSSPRYTKAYLQNYYLYSIAFVGIVA